jgi:tetratricopeptide (TPR) repeat protein
MAATPSDEVFFCRGPERHCWLTAEDAAKCCNGFTRQSRVKVTKGDVVALEFYWRPVRTNESLPPFDGTSDRTQHLVFAHRLSELAESESAVRLERYPWLVAGWMTLKILERWIAYDHEPSLREAVAVQTAVDDLPAGTGRDVLKRIVKHIRGEPDLGHTICMLLVLYGAVLEDEAEWMLAADVYETVIDRANRVKEPDARPTAYQRLAYCRRQLGDLRSAAKAIRDGRHAARILGDTVAELRLRLVDANLTIHRGNYPKAAQQLDEIIALARAGENRAPLAMALHDRGIVALERNEADTAIATLFEAIETYDDPTLKQRAQLDLAWAFANVGWRDVAHDALVPLYLGATLRECRLNAAINLMDLAAQSGHAADFERYRQVVEGQELPARPHANYLLVLGQAYQRFGADGAAARWYEELHTFASARGLNEHVIKAEQGLEGIAPPTAPEPQPIGEQAVSVAVTLRERRMALAGDWSASPASHQLDV